MKDCEYTMACEGQRRCLPGHKEIETVSHNANIIANRYQGYEPNWEKHQFERSTSAEKCVLVRKNPHYFLKHTCSLEKNVENLESHPVSTANNHSHLSEHRLRLNIHSKMPENQKFKNEGENSQYNQFNESFSKGLLFLNQQIFSANSEICNIDINGRDLTEPSLSNTYGGVINMEQLYRCSKMSNALHKSSTPNNYKSMYDGVRSYSCNETGYNLDQDPNVMKYQGLQLSDNDSKSNQYRNVFYQSSDLTSYKSIHIGEKNHNCCEYGKGCNQSSKLIQTKQKCCKCNICGKVLSKSSSLNRHRLIHIGRKPFKCTVYSVWQSL